MKCVFPKCEEDAIEGFSLCTYHYTLGKTPGHYTDKKKGGQVLIKQKPLKKDKDQK